MTIAEKLKREITRAFLKHFWRYLWTVCRVARWDQFLDFLIPQVHFATKELNPDTRWQAMVVALAKEQVNLSFQPLSLFNLQFADDNGELWKTGEEFVAKNTANLDTVLETLNNFVRHLTLLKEFQFTAADLVAVLIDDYPLYSRLVFFADYAGHNLTDPTNLRKYLRNVLRVSDPDQWFINEKELNDTLEQFIWPGGEHAGYETYLADYERRMLYFTYSQLVYCQNHPSLDTELSGYYFNDFQQVTLSSAELRQTEQKRWCCPPLVFYYPENQILQAKLGENNHFVKFVKGYAEDDFITAIKSAEPVVETVKEKKIILTSLPHLYGEAEGTLKIPGKFSLQLTNFLSPLRFSEWTLLVDDLSTDASCALTYQTALKNTQEINRLQATLKEDKTKTTQERVVISQKLNALKQASAQLAADRAFPSEKTSLQKLEQALNDFVISANIRV